MLEIKDIHLSRLEAETLRQAAEFALEHDAMGSVFYGDRQTALRRSMRKIEDYLATHPDLGDD